MSCNEQMDITKELQAENRAFLALESHIYKLMFRLNIKTKYIQYYGKLKSLYNIPSESDGFPRGFVDNVTFYGDGRRKFDDFVEEIYKGEEEIEQRIQLVNEHGSCEWYQFEYTYIRDEQGEAVEAVGCMRNIEVQRKTELDELTGCLRKKTFEEYASQYIIENGKESVAFIIDIDDFKAINDNFGHQYGDIVLKNIGEGLRSVIRESDYVGRIGGDEFMIFLKNVSSESIIQEKADAILDVLSHSHDATIDGELPSGSVGIARFPQDGFNFEAIYKRADQALYHAKSNGKNQYAFYTEGDDIDIVVSKTPLEVSQNLISRHFDTVLVADVFNLLFEAINFEASMNSVLKQIGTRFSVDRCYIFEPSEVTEAAYDNTYEWCNKGIQAEIESLQGIPHEMLVGSFFDEANEEGMFWCDDIKSLNDEEARELMGAQGIKSFLHSYISKGEHMVAVVGFDDCTNNRIWQPLEITTLSYINKTIAQFLSYMRVLKDKADK